MKPTSNHINYIEFKANNLEKIKDFYSESFGWTFKDFGPDYTSFSNSGVNGGFEKSDSEISNGILVVLYHSNLDSIKNFNSENILATHNKGRHQQF